MLRLVVFNKGGEMKNKTLLIAVILLGCSNLLTIYALKCKTIAPNKRETVIMEKDIIVNEATKIVDFIITGKSQVGFKLTASEGKFDIYLIPIDSMKQWPTEAGGNRNNNGSTIKGPDYIIKNTGNNKKRLETWTHNELVNRSVYWKSEVNVCDYYEPFVGGAYYIVIKDKRYKSDTPLKANLHLLAVTTEE
jgi:hypothetical protein